MSQEPNYQQLSAEEFVNHSLESALSAITSAAFYGAGRVLDTIRSFIPKQQIKAVVNLGSYFLKFCGTRFAKDTVIELIAAIGHLPVANKLGETLTDYMGYEKNERSIGSQETYSQIVEGTNKILPLAVFTVFIKPHISRSVYELDKISFSSEISTSYIRAVGYFLYDLDSPNANYTTEDHFVREYELHTETEGVLLVPLAVAAHLFLGEANPIASIIVEEATIEFFKGLSFKAVQTNCPSCLNYKDAFSDYVEELLLGDAACHTQEPHIDL